MRIEVTGERPGGVVLHFGAPPVPEATTTVAIGDEAFAQLIGGESRPSGRFHATWESSPSAGTSRSR